MHKLNPVHTRIKEKGAVIPQDTDPDLPVSGQESLVEACMGQQWPAAGSGTLSVAVLAQDI